jgi:hypothetical protein
MGADCYQQRDKRFTDNVGRMRQGSRYRHPDHDCGSRNHCFHDDGTSGDHVSHHYWGKRWPIDRRR